MAGELESGGLAEPTGAGVGVAVTVTETVTGEHDGQVGHAADEPASPGTRAAGTDGTAEPACAGTGTTGEETAGVATARTELDGDGVAMTGGPTTAVEDAPASTAIGLEVGTGTMGITVGVLWAGQFLTVGAQLVTISSMVLKAVASATAGAETCS